MLIFDLPHLSIYSKSHKSFKSSGCQREREGGGGGRGRERPRCLSLLLNHLSNIVAAEGNTITQTHQMFTHTVSTHTRPLNLSQLPPRGSSLSPLQTTFTLTSETFLRRFKQTHKHLQSQTKRQRTAFSLTFPSAE